MTVTFDTSELLHLVGTLDAAAVAATPMAAEVVGVSAEELLHTAEQLAPVLTGELRASGRVEKSGLTATVIFDSDHAGYVEYGTSDTAPQPYLNPAADQQENSFIGRL